jgi:hypothetical protein
MINYLMKMNIFKDVVFFKYKLNLIIIILNINIIKVIKIYFIMLIIIYN